jgi:hypothetical protein
MNEIKIASVAHPYGLFQRRPDLNHNQLDVARRFGAIMGVNAAAGDAVVGIHGVKADLRLERFWRGGVDVRAVYSLVHDVVAAVDIRVSPVISFAKSVARNATA